MKEIPSERPQLTTLHAEIGFALIHRGTLRSMLQKCTEVLVQSLDASFVRIWTFNEKKGALELQSSAGMYTHIDGDHSIIPVGMYKIGLIAKERKPHLTNAVIGDPGVHNQEWAKREEIVSFAGYPMIVEGRLIGVLALFSKKQLPDDILKILASVSDNVAIGIDRKQVEESLRKSEERLAEVQRIAHIGNWERDIITNEIYWSDEMYHIFGLKHQEYNEITYERFLNCIHPDDREFVKKSIHDALYGKKPYEIDYRVIHENGTVRIVHSRALVKFDHTGKPVRMIGTVQDITDRKRVEEELRLEKNKLQSVIDAMEDGLTIQDLDYNIVYQNEVLKNIFGVRLGCKCYSSYESKDTICDGCPVEMVYKDGKPHISERRVVIPSGEIVYVENIASPIKDGNGKIVYCLEICRNITERKNHESQILYMANRDPLTDLFNRRRFHDELEHWLAETRRFGTKGALLYLDIDNFKDINDSFGHRVGDKLLINFSNLIKTRLRRQTDLLARLGGDEFAVILPHVDLDEAELIANQILELVQHNTLVEKGTLTRITVSIGIALFPDHGDKAETILTSVDLAMYMAKEKGRNRACVYTHDQKTKIG